MTAATGKFQSGTTLPNTAELTIGAPGPPAGKEVFAAECRLCGPKS